MLCHVTQKYFYNLYVLFTVVCEIQMVIYF